MELYGEHVRHKFLACSKSKKWQDKDPKNGALTFFLDSRGQKLTVIQTAVDWFKKRIVEAGIHTLEELKQLTAKDFRTCISSWANDHKNPNVRLNAATLNNHVPESLKRKKKMKEAMGQSLALQKDLIQLAATEKKESDLVLGKLKILSPASEASREVSTLSR